MTEKEKCQCYIELFKSQMKRFEDTRKIQWRANLAFWTFLVAGGALLYRSGYELCIIESIIVIAFFFSVHLFLWNFPIQRSLDEDKRLFSKYRNRAEVILGEKVVEGVSEVKLSWKWPIGIAFVTAAILGIIFWIIIRRS